MADEIKVPTSYCLIGPSEDGKVNDLLQTLDAKASSVRLQALIAGWLRMENLVVLTGAGTSVSSGGKIMSDLEKNVLSTVKALPETTPEIAMIIDARIAEQKLGPSRQKGETPKKLGFEDWLSYIVNAGQIAIAPSSPIEEVVWRNCKSPKPEELTKFIANLGKSIFAECALTLPNTDSAPSSTSDVAPHLAFLAKLVARDSNLGRAHLFTLNYDTLFEQALELIGIQYFDGFTGRANARFDPSVYGLDIYYPGEVAEGRVRRFDKFLHFYKLHGSIHWRVLGDEIRAHHPELRDFSCYHEKDASGKAEFFKRFTDRIPAVGILPTANKFAQTLTMPFAHLFRSFQIRLSAPQTFLLILGYGFGDDHVNHIIEAALMNPSLVMLVVEPNPESPIIERVRRYKELGKRAFVLTSAQAAHEAAPYKVASFDDFSRAIMPDVQWLDDFLRLRRLEKQIQTVKAPGMDEQENGAIAAG
jgi:hypothetical protein